MPGELIYNPEPPHTCSDRPRPFQVAPGAIWKCSECNAYWRCEYVGGDSYAWRRITGLTAFLARRREA